MTGPRFSGGSSGTPASLRAEQGRARVPMAVSGDWRDGARADGQ